MLKTMAGNFVILAFLISGCTSSELNIPNVHTVTPGLLVRGGQPDEAGLKLLQRTYGVELDVNLNNRTADSEAIIAKRLGLRYLAIPSDPFRPDPAKLRAFLAAIQNAIQSGAVVYVHCKDGMDRTGVAVAVFRMIDEDWSYGRAMKELRQYQTLPHALLFMEIPIFLRTVDAHREQWRK